MPRPARRLARAVAITTVTSLTVAGAGAFWAWEALGDVRRIDLAESLDGDQRGPENFLIVGSDSRESADPSSPDYGSMGDEGDVGGQRSDTIMLMRIDPGAGTTTLLSLPRDLYVTRAGSKAKGRINGAYAKGPNVLIATVRDNLRVPIHHYVEIEFQGFKSIVDALGGVGVWFDTPVRDRNTGLVVAAPGCTTLNGVQALAYARSRHMQWNDGRRWSTDGTGDLGRISRQQDFMRRAMTQAVEKVSGNPLGVAALVDATIGHLTVDSNLSNTDLLGLARRFASIGSSGLTTYTFPATPKTIAGASVLVPNFDAAEPILALFADPASGTAFGLGETAGGVLPEQSDSGTPAAPPATKPIGVVGDPTQPC